MVPDSGKETLTGKDNPEEPRTPGSDSPGNALGDAPGEAHGESTDKPGEKQGGDPETPWGLDGEGKDSDSDPAEDNSERNLEKDQEIADLKEKTLRTLAELENFKKRTLRENADQLRYANETILIALLPVLDGLERAIEHMKGETEVSRVSNGIELIYRQCLESFKKFGVVPIQSLGESFDPNHHQAMNFIETSEHPENTVAEELQKGYLYHDRVIRPSMVTVARKPSTEDPGAEEKTGTEEDP